MIVDAQAFGIFRRECDRCLDTKRRKGYGGRSGRLAEGKRSAVIILSHSTSSGGLTACSHF